jgi:hypothetical protein
MAKRGLNGLGKNSLLLLGGVAALEAFVLYPMRKKQHREDADKAYKRAISDGQSGEQAQLVASAAVGKPPRMFGLFNI